MRMLDGVTVALGITGSIAAVRVVELAHELRRRGATVRGVMTESARGIVHPDAVAYATDEPVVTELTGAVEHVELCGADGWADVLLLAPATANTVGKVAAAVDDTPVSTCATVALGAETPVVVAPAMHEPMYDHPGVIDALERLEEWGVELVPPRVEEGKAKIAGDEAIACETARAAGDRRLDGRHVVVTSGATSEPIDPVRVLTNRSSGRTGRAVAAGCYVRGADVTLVHDGPDVPYADVRRVETSREMIDAVEKLVGGAGADGNAGAGADGNAGAGADGNAGAGDDAGPATAADALVSAAAIGDYAVEAAPEKLPSGRDDLSLELAPTPKLVDRVREAAPELPIVGFKVESHAGDEELVAAARGLLDRAGLAFVVANDASVMGAETTRALIVRDNGSTPFEGPKAALGLRVADEIAGELAGESSGSRPAESSGDAPGDGA